MQDTEYRASYCAESTHWWFVSRDNLVLDSIKALTPDYSSGIDLFDIGCGTGGFLERCANENFFRTLSGCEPNSIGYKYSCNRGLNVSQSGFEDLDPEAQSFDIITCMDVLYHKNVDVDQALQVIWPLLRPGGLLVINVPAMHQLAGTHDLKVEAGRRFEKEQLAALLKKYQFSIETLQYWNTLLTPAIWAFRQIQNKLHSGRLNRPHSEVQLPNIVVNRLLLYLLFLERELATRVTFPFGCSLLAAARKPYHG
jgi:2-polyprenyl-3-methyl-5-hydroxy-6-metoxy-1,4-benzoquinol methylase